MLQVVVAVIGAIAVLLGVVVAGVFSRRAAERDHRRRLVSDATRDLLRAVAMSSLGDRRAALEAFAAAKTALVVSAEPAALRAVLDFGRSGGSGRDPAARAALVALVQATRANKDLNGDITDAEVHELLFAADPRDSR